MNLYYCGSSQRTFIYNSKGNSAFYQGIKALWEIGSRLLPEQAKKNIIFI
jgi:hypothetical protein